MDKRADYSCCRGTQTKNIGARYRELHDGRLGTVILAPLDCQVNAGNLAAIRATPVPQMPRPLFSPSPSPPLGEPCASEMRACVYVGMRVRLTPLPFRWLSRGNAACRHTSFASCSPGRSDVRGSAACCRRPPAWNLQGLALFP